MHIVHLDLAQADSLGIRAKPLVSRIRCVYMTASALEQSGFMAAGDSLVAHVPYLRRFARALTRSQAIGDRCVVAALETILAGKSSNIPGPHRALSVSSR